jgi:hypothetical protein
MVFKVVAEVFSRAKSQSCSTFGNKGRLAKNQNFSMISTVSLAEINQMTVHEKLTVMEQIWDSLCHEESEIESPAWHRDILKERKKRMDSSDAKYLTVEELRNRYR